MAYLTKLSNFTSMTVQRVHYAIKKAFARGKQLEFVWRQLWSIITLYAVLYNVVIYVFVVKILMKRRTYFVIYSRFIHTTFRILVDRIRRCAVNLIFVACREAASDVRGTFLQYRFLKLMSKKGCQIFFVDFLVSLLLFVCFQSVDSFGPIQKTRGALSIKCFVNSIGRRFSVRHRSGVESTI